MNLASWTSSLHQTNVKMKKTQATIKDIARKLNIAPSTVSRALKDHYSISQKTKDAVLALARELNYRPNAIALSLLNKKTNIIGVLIPEIVQPFYSQAISGIEEEAISAGYNVMICQSNESLEREKNVLKALENSRVDGIIACHATEPSNFAHIRDIKDAGIPLVLLDRVIDDMDVSKVVANDRQGAFTITKHLILSGNLRIAHIAGPNNLSVSRNRLSGYLQALRHYKIPVRDELIVRTTLDKEDVINCVKKLCNLPEPPDAIFCVNDPAAVQAVQYLKSKGLCIPEDMAIAGFDNQPVTVYMEPALTTIIQPAYEMGREAAKLLLYEIEHPDEEVKPVIKSLETRLITRNSTVRKRTSVA